MPRQITEVTVDLFLLMPFIESLGLYSASQFLMHEDKPMLLHTSPLQYSIHLMPPT
jgi:hypothetical protein